MLLASQFQRKFGIHRLDMVTSPRKFLISQFEAPQNAMFHFVSQDLMEDGPALDWQMLNGISKSQMISVLHETEMARTEAARFVGIAVDNAITSYHQTHRRFTRAKTFKAMASSERTAGIVNYGFVARRYKYDNKTLQTDYQATMNMFATVIEGVRKAVMNSTRDNYLVMELPEVWPDVTTLNGAAQLGLEGKVMSNDFIKRLGGPGGWTFAELWKWVNNQRLASMFSVFTIEQLSRVNIVFQTRGRWAVINLAFLNRIRVTPPDEAVAKEHQVTRGMEPLALAKTMLRGLTTLSAGLVNKADEDDDQIVIDDDDSDDDFVIPDMPVGAMHTGPDPAAALTAIPGLGKKPPKAIPPTAPRDRTVNQIVNHSLNVNDPMAGMDEADLIELEQAIDRELVGLTDIARKRDEQETQNTDGVVRESELLPEAADTAEAQFMANAMRMAAKGQISAAELRRFERLSRNYKEKIILVNGQTAEEFMEPSPEEVTIVDRPKIHVDGLVDQGVVGSTIRDFDRQYIQKVMHRDIVANIVNIQRSDLIIQDIKYEHIKDPLGNVHVYKVRVVPLRGKPTTWELRFPEVDRNGTYYVNGVGYKHRKQIGQHMPIAKITPSQVALTSYYGKLFITRGMNNANDYGIWLANAVRAKTIGTEEVPAAIFDLASVDVFNERNNVPRAYSALSRSFSSFKFRRSSEPNLTYSFHFVYKGRESFFGDEVVRKYEKDGSVLIAVVNNGYLVMDSNDVVSIVKDGNKAELGPIETFLELDYGRAPSEFAHMGIMGHAIPVGILLGYRMGIDRLIALTRASVRKVNAGQHLKLAPNEYAVRFADQSYIFDKRDRKATLILGGFTRFHKSTTNYTAHDFNDPAVYMNLLEEDGIPSRLLIEHDDHHSLFIDAQTRRLLVQMGEPKTFQPLLLRAVDLLVTDYVPEYKNRLRGYDRFAGMAYTQMINARRAHNNRPNAEARKIDLHPYAVWQEIVTDSAKIIESNINPIEDLKQIEAVTYTGTGGRSMRSLVKSTRQYRENEEGLVGDGTVDNGSVGANAYLCANPKINSVYGTYDTWDPETDDPSRLVSTSMLLSPGADTDDTKRVVFIGIQHGHGIACEGGTPAIVRTGYENVLATRTSEMFAQAADMDGKVISIDEEGIVVEYSDGERVGYPLGRRYGTSSSLRFPFTIVSDMKPGQKFKAGTNLCYNKEFFAKDYLNPNGVTWKAGVIARVAVIEAKETYEDSSSISRSLANKLRTKTSVMVPIVVNFGNALHKVVKEGQEVKADDFYMIIESESTTGSTVFNDESIESLRNMQANVPAAKRDGLVERIEVFYNGEKDQMHESLRSLVTASDRAMIRRANSAGKDAFNGKRSESYRVDGNPLMPGTAVICIWVTSEVGTGTGDKGVLGNQLKTVFGNVMEDTTQTESGFPIDLYFGSIAIGNRIVPAAYSTGAAGMLMYGPVTERFIRAYRNLPNPK